MLLSRWCADADTDPKAWKWAAIIIPLILVGLMALMFGCYRKYVFIFLAFTPINCRWFASDI